jgi:hypothetical protein
MNKTRLEAFSDGVIAIIITIMVLELKVPHGTDLATLAPLVPVFLSYVLSFIYLAIYWNNHHHMLHTSRNVRRDADCALRIRAADGGRRLLLAGADDHRLAGAGLGAQAVEGDLCARRIDVARARPAHREGAGAPRVLKDKP